MFNRIYSFINKVKSKLSQKGQGMVEYALIIAFVAVIAGVLLNSNLKTAVETAFSKATEQLNTATGTNTNGGSSTPAEGGGGGGN